MSSTNLRPLLAAATEPYRQAGRFAHHFALGKLGRDPVYRALLELGLLGTRRSVLDLGCGQGLLTSWLRAAQRLHAQGEWPEGWPAPPPASVRGLELMPKDVARAHRALGTDCGVELGDIRLTEFGQTEAVVILDVMHYMRDAAQRDVLKKVRAALPTGGLLLLRVGDAKAGLSFHYTQCVDRAVMFLRGHSWVRTFCRPLNEWLRVVEEHGFEASAAPMNQGTPFANVLLVATAR